MSALSDPGNAGIKDSSASETHDGATQLSAAADGYDDHSIVDQHVVPDEKGVDDNDDDDVDDDNEANEEYESEGDDDWPFLFESHLDHKDWIHDSNRWREPFHQPTDWQFYADHRSHYHINDQLYASTQIQQRMQQILAMRKGGYMPLDTALSRSDHIPLFADRDGNEYQVKFGASPTIRLPRIACPSTDFSMMTAGPLFQLRCRNAEGMPKTVVPPKHIMYWGTFWVRTHTKEPTPIAELTDYAVVIDVDHEDLPVWILAPSKQVRFEGIRGQPNGPPWGFLALPIFDGLMADGDGNSYDTACILSSVRQMGIRPGEPGAPSYQESCDLVRRTRMDVDPAAVLLPRERLLEYVSADYIPDTWSPALAPPGTT